MVVLPVELLSGLVMLPSPDILLAESDTMILLGMEEEAETPPTSCELAWTAGHVAKAGPVDGGSVDTVNLAKHSDCVVEAGAMSFCLLTLPDKQSSFLCSELALARQLSSKTAGLSSDLLTNFCCLASLWPDA